MGLYIGNEKIGGGLITKVNALPEANATNYAKNQLYLYENKLYFIVLDGSTYKMKKLGQDATLISFTIAGTSYQAEDGMTWEEWVSSSYNTAGFVVKNGYTYQSSSSAYHICLNSTDIPATAEIVANASYTLENQPIDSGGDIPII